MKQENFHNGDVEDEISPATEPIEPTLESAEKVTDVFVSATDPDPIPQPTPKPDRRVSLGAAIASLVTAVVIAVMSTFALTVNYMKKDVAPIVNNTGSGEKNVFDELEFLDFVFRELTVNELDENFETQILKSYVAATGDIYAEYYTAEELRELSSDQNGEMCGIGVTVVNGTCTVDEVIYPAIVVVNVYKDSPAEAAGVLPGDCILYVGSGDDAVLVGQLGYTEALNRLLGEEGTACEFIVFRQDGIAYQMLGISAVRQKIVKQSVYGRVYMLDPTVGVIRISEFDNTTATQFRAAVEELQGKGCTSFVLDLRGNPGGLLTSVQDMLTFFLQEGDTMISVKDNRGNEETSKVIVSSKGQVLTGSKTLKREDVGLYRNLNFSVLVNGYSASAAELFTANMRDYNLATIVGTKTFGKGSMQSTIPLSNYGFEGALKLTTAYYYPPSGVGYHGIGIQPDEGYEVELSKELQNMNINLLTDEQDNQLAAAVKALQPAS